VALTLYLIRHGEKPDEKLPALGPGLTDHGEPNKKSLVIRGWQRAGSWAALFGSSFGGADYLIPQTIFAADPDQTGSDDDDKVSKRPWETAKPLAEKCKPAARIVKNIGKGSERELVKQALASSGVALICWEHQAIMDNILPLIPVTSGARPEAWPSDRFDVVLRLVRGDDETGFAITQLFPQLLQGDSDMPLPTSG
jgi:hypothetical protein